MYYSRGLSLISRRAGTTTDYYYTDYHGSVVRCGDATYGYDAFGNKTGTSSSDNNSFRYCGEYTDSESGLVYLRARYYNSETGRFTIEEPAKDSVNWYTYCGNNPILFIDPSGLSQYNPSLNSVNEKIKNLRNLNIEGFIEEFIASVTTTDPITVIEMESSIAIYAYLNIYGTQADKTFEGSN